jgi:RHS repeat-associated protein
VPYEELELNDIVAGGDYYPFGSVMTGREITRDDYRFGYQGQFAELDEETGWNSFELRMYDAVIGRWMSPDPYRQFASPYVGMGNNPMKYVDKDGGCVGPDCAPIAKVGDCMCSYVEDGMRYTEIPASDLYSDFAINEVGHTITSGGWDWFINYFDNPDFGENYFFQAAEQFPHNATGLMAWIVENREGVGPAISLSRLTHLWIDNAGWSEDLNALEHHMGMFLISERFGPGVANSIGHANEFRGFGINDRQSGNMWRALLGMPARNGGSTAFEWSDINNNSIGINKWREYHGLPIVLH